MRTDFDLMPVEYQRDLQPDAPVQVCCSRQCLTRRSGAAFVQVRLLNRSDCPVCSVYLCLEGLDALGQRRFLLDETVLANLDAPGHSLFGEERMLALPEVCSSLRILLRRVIFIDGTRWCSQGEPVLADPEALGWSRCACGCWNKPTAERCALCRASFWPVQAAEASQCSP